MSFHGAGDPQAIDVEIALRLYGHPGVFCRDVFDEAFPPFFTPIKDKALFKTLLEPLLFHVALFIGHGTADMLGVKTPEKDTIGYEIQVVNKESTILQTINLHSKTYL